MQRPERSNGCVGGGNHSNTDEGGRMRIQETDRILKEARVARNAAASQEQHYESVVSRAWHAVTRFFRKS